MKLPNMEGPKNLPIFPVETEQIRFRFAQQSRSVRSRSCHTCQGSLKIYFFSFDDIPLRRWRLEYWEWQERLLLSSPYRKFLKKKKKAVRKKRSKKKRLSLFAFPPHILSLACLHFFPLLLFSSPFLLSHTLLLASSLLLELIASFSSFPVFFHTKKLLSLSPSKAEIRAISASLRMSGVGSAETNIFSNPATALGSGFNVMMSTSSLASIA